MVNRREPPAVYISFQDQGMKGDESGTWAGAAPGGDGQPLKDKCPLRWGPHESRYTIKFLTSTHIHTETQRLM